ncbi:Uncharacterised protein at_DN0249, partial [Pycnogonum litorale]
CVYPLENLKVADVSDETTGDIDSSSISSSLSVDGSSRSATPNSFLQNNQIYVRPSYMDIVKEVIQKQIVIKCDKKRTVYDGFNLDSLNTKTKKQPQKRSKVGRRKRRGKGVRPADVFQSLKTVLSRKNNLEMLSDSVESTNSQSNEFGDTLQNLCDSLSVNEEIDLKHLDSCIDDKMLKEFLTST